MYIRLLLHFNGSDLENDSYLIKRITELTQNCQMYFRSNRFRNTTQLFFTSDPFTQNQRLSSDIGLLD